MPRRCHHCSALLGLADATCQFCGTAFDPNAAPFPSATPASPANYIPPQTGPRSNSAPPASDLSKISDPNERRVTRLIKAVLCVLLICVVAGAGVYALHLKRTNDINQASWQAYHQRLAAEEQAREGANAAHFQQQRAAQQNVVQPQVEQRATQADRQRQYSEVPTLRHWEPQQTEQEQANATEAARQSDIAQQQAEDAIFRAALNCHAAYDDLRIAAPSGQPFGGQWAAYEQATQSFQQTVAAAPPACLSDPQIQSYITSVQNAGRAVSLSQLPLSPPLSHPLPPWSGPP